MLNLAPRSLHGRVSLVLTALAGLMMLLLVAGWLNGTRTSIREEVEAAARVSVPLLNALTEQRAPLNTDEMIAIVRPLGRVRANELTVFADDGQLIYRSPAPAYKAGRLAPPWFAHLLLSEHPPRELMVGAFRLVLQPDPSRALLDAWDELVALSGWALLLLVTLFIALRLALHQALQPLEEVMRALEKTGGGCFETRLPVFSASELGRVAQAFNSMADRLRSAVDQNVRLETEREVNQHLQSRIAEERLEIARELHDELAQGITAVRALAGAIAQRTTDQPALHGHAQSVIAVTGTMQDGIRTILHRLRQPMTEPLELRLNACLDAWHGQFGQIEIERRIDLGDLRLAEPVCNALLRIVQEGLTNVSRHATGATRVVLSLGLEDGDLCLRLSDNGRTQPGETSAQAGSGLGLAGMGERVARLGGRLDIQRAADCGFALQVRLPVTAENLA